MEKFNYSSNNSLVEQVVIHNTCIHCHKENEVIVDAAPYAKWRTGGLIQNLFPQLNYNQREMIQTGIHSECFDEMFPPHNDHEDDDDN